MQKKLLTGNEASILAPIAAFYGQSAAGHKVA